jgi:hypothetical protein
MEIKKNTIKFSFYLFTIRSDIDNLEKINLSNTSASQSKLLFLSKIIFDEVFFWVIQR